MISDLRSHGLIRLRVRTSNALGWIVPLWAGWCGAVASGGLHPTLEDGGRLLLLFLLVEGGWGTLWEALSTTDWAPHFRRWQHWRLEGRVHTLPYTQPGSPGDRLSRWLSQLTTWYQTILMPSTGRRIGAAVGGLVLSLALALALGQGILLLTVAALALMQLALVATRGRGNPPAGWDGALRLGLPWMAGHLAFGPATLPSAGLALAFGFAIAGAQDHPRGPVLWTASTPVTCAT